MASRYKRFVKICTMWPQSEIRGKYTKTLGSHIQEQVKRKFTHQDSTYIEDMEKCDRILLSMERLAGDYYKKVYTCNSTFTGASLEELSMALDEDAEQYKKTDSSFKNLG